MNGEDRETRRRLARIGGSRPDVDADLDAEFEFHFREVVDALIDDGRSLAEAEAEATRRLGNLTRYRHKLRRIGRRRRRRIVSREIGVALANSIGWAFRSIRRRPGFSAVIIGTLALGIGANTLVFGVVDRLLLSPPEHVVDADEVRCLYRSFIDEDGFSFTKRRFAYPDYLSLHRVSDFRQIAAYRPSQWLPVGVGEEVRKAYVVQATFGLFPLLGVNPLLGRFFTEEEDKDGALRTVVLSEEYWTLRFGRDPSVIGRTVSIGREFHGDALYEVIGVAPAGFTGAELSRVDLWIAVLPELGQRAHNWRNNFMNIVVRLRDGASPEGADNRATAVHRAARAAWVEEEGVEWYDPEVRVFTSSIIAARGPNPSAVSSVSKWLAALSVIVLVVACANVTNLLLANNIRIRQELAIRASLGAGPARVAGELLIQTVILATLGGLAGLVMWFTLSPFLHAAFLPTAGFTESDLVPRVLVFAGTAVLMTSLGAGLVPALQTRRLTDVASLNMGSRGSPTGSSHLRNSLVAIQTTLSVVLLIGAGLFVVSLRRAREFDMGFSAVGVAEVELEFRAGVGSLRRKEIFREALNRIRAIPGVHLAATYAGSRPLHSDMGYDLRTPGQESVPVMPGGSPNWFQGSADFPEAYGIRIVQGRTTDPADAQPGAEPVMLVSALTARTLWPDGEVLGGFNWSSQHLKGGASDYGWEEATFGSSREREASISRKAFGGKSCRAASVLGSHRGRVFERGRRDDGWGVAPRWLTLVSGGGRDATFAPHSIIEAAVGTIPVLCRTRRCRDLSCTGSWRSRDRSSAWSSPVDDLTRATAKCGYTERRVRVPCHDGPVARRPIGSKAQACDAGGEQGSTDLRGRSARWEHRHTGWVRSCGTCGSLDWPSARP